MEPSVIPTHAANPYLRAKVKNAIPTQSLAYNTKRIKKKMTGNLLDQLTKKPQRETAGADSASRFDYQKDWAFCRMIRKHIDGEDYLVAFEFHDDVVFLTPSTAPQIAEFCQVKTSSSANPRKLSALTTRPKGNASILAKMIANFDGICASQDVHVFLVSNNAYEFSDKDICAKDIDEKFRNKLLDKLKDEIDGFDSAKLERIHFKVTGVSLDAMSSYLNGEAMELFCEKFGEDHGLNVRNWIRLVQGEIKRKNNHASDEIASADDLIKNKCIDQPFVESTLSTMQARTRKPANIGFVFDILVSAGWSQVDIFRMQKKIPQANGDYYNSVNDEVVKLAEEIKPYIYDSNGEPKDITDFLDDVVASLAKSGTSFNPYLQPDYLRALGVLVYFDEI